MVTRAHTQHAYVNDPAALIEAWNDANHDKKMRARDAAAFLGVSECELVAAHVGTVATRLAAPNNEWAELLKRMKSVGRVMALTRNHAVVHERKGVYLDASAMGKMGLVLGDDIDLRLFFSNWHHGYALSEADGALTKRSIQFFDDAGEAVHKIFLQAESDINEFDMFVEQFRATNQDAGERVLEKTAMTSPAINHAIDVDAFQTAWANLQDTHEFFGLLKKFNVPRTQALRIAEKQFATEVTLSSAKQILEAAAAQKADIMCFVGNQGCIQIHTGAVNNVVMMGPWLNVLDPDFNLHLREDMIHEAWVVRKPTVDGIVTSLELFDASGVQITQFFGKRKPGLPEREDWRQIIAAIEANTVAGVVALENKVPA